MLLLLACAHVPAEAPPAACAECHADTVEAWSSSRHASARTNALFTESFARTDHPWCLQCHAAEGDGVGCATCHGPESRTCADCHQFDLPVQLGGPPSGTAGQDTVREWERSWFADRACTDCHDPHTATGGHDRQRVRDALDVAVWRVEDGVAARLTTTGVGHALPTGDPFRRLRLDVCDDLACRTPAASWVLQRRLAHTATGWVIVEDSRIGPAVDGPSASVERVLPAPRARAWRLVYHLADPRHEPALGDASRWVVSAGRVEEAP